MVVAKHPDGWLDAWPGERFRDDERHVSDDAPHRMAFAMVLKMSSMRGDAFMSGSRTTRKNLR
jgi:hypothetical protein